VLAIRVSIPPLQVTPTANTPAPWPFQLIALDPNDEPPGICTSLGDAEIDPVAAPTISVTKHAKKANIFANHGILLIFIVIIVTKIIYRKCKHAFVQVFLQNYNFFVTNVPANSHT